MCVCEYIYMLFNKENVVALHIAVNTVVGSPMSKVLSGRLQGIHQNQADVSMSTLKNEAFYAGKNAEG